ncbi:CbtA family protein [Mycobacterium vicinigordonae]|uniref:CbtA family protein n=1 Tax=Mycobacterium vicinigordonae TaxID=1719132 RepID=A0A7D6HPT1_9MYCO|nr:CbtA family protein [Mycobacterium vicinigordonae]QLL07091.1 CbtA family protein [Mycobacterium vicinigordonae]
MEQRLILRGLLAGVLGAMLAFVFARLFAEPVISRAVEFEEARAERAPGVHEHGAELFSRGVQGNAGLGFGVLLFGVALGALFAVLFGVVYPRSENTAPQLLSIRLAVGGFVAAYLVPFLKYPANPPAVGQADTIGSRTSWYLVLVLASVVLAIAAVRLSRRLRKRFGAFNAGCLAVAAYAAAVALIALVLPSVAETPPGFPADVLYEFRLVSLGTQLVLWVSIGLAFGVLAGQALNAGDTQAPSTAP